MNKKIFMPFGVEHNRLDKIANGRDDVIVDPERLGKLAEGENLTERAQEFYEIERDNQGQYATFVYVEEPEEINGIWHIRKFLTEAGQRAHDALKIGWVWNVQEMDVSIEGTNDLYGDMLKKGRITRHYAELIATNKDDRLRELRNMLVYFKLRAKDDGKDGFVEIKDAT